ncbi:MAG: PIN domain-containing protein [Candidatus Sulfotelmatobacter sp.]
MSSERLGLWASLRRFKPEKRNRPLQRRPDTELDFIETTRTKPAKLLFDTTVYIDILRGRFPETGLLILRAVQAWHSPVTEAELVASIGMLDPSHPQSRKIVEEIADLIDRRPIPRTITPDVIIWREAAIVSGILARLQSYKKDERRRVLNDALLYITARRHGCTLLTRNITDFDFLQQLDPSGRVLFYRV